MPTRKRPSHRNLRFPKRFPSRTEHDAAYEDSPVLTAGELLSDGTLIEPIYNAATGRLSLLVSVGNERRITSEAEFRGRVYRPVDIDPSVLRAMRFPTKCGRFRSTTELFTQVRETFMSRSFPEEVASPTSYFAFAAWFTEFLPAAPCLLLTGPPAEAHLLLELLGCMVRHPLPLGHLTASSFCSLPMHLQPSLVINQVPTSRSVWGLLNASNYRSSHVPRNHGLANLFCAKAIYAGENHGVDDLGDSALRIDIPPSHGRLPVLDAKDPPEISAKFQPQMLAYRCQNIVKVRESGCDFPEFDSGIRILGRILGAPLVDAPELQADLEPLLRERQEEIQAAKWLDLHCVTLEAVLRHCHENPENKVHILGITKTVNLIYKGRGQTTEFEPEVIGHILRQHKFSPRRDGPGYYIVLDDQTRRHAHLAARRRGVAAIQVGMSKCSLCSEILATDGIRTFSDSRSKGQKL